jgi:hypothetical protein
MRRSVAFVLAVIVLSGCAGLDPRPQGRVQLYGRTVAPDPAWIGLAPDPAQTVGFGRDAGVACRTGPIGTEIVWFDGDPKDGGQAQRSLGRLAGGPDPTVIWVDVAADGSMTTGVGVPAWWVDEAPAC